jgi:hypothetical protein
VDNVWLPACTLRVGFERWACSVWTGSRCWLLALFSYFLIIFHPLSIEVQILYFMTELQQKGFVEFQVSEMDAKRNYALLLKIKNERLDLATIETLVDKALTDTVEARLVGSPTNSPIGSSHWFNTILGNIAHIGDYMQTHELTDEQRATWGKQLSENARHLIGNYTKIPFHY